MTGPSQRYAEFRRSVREAEELSRSVAGTAASLDDTIERTKAAIRDSRRLMQHADRLLGR